MRVFLSHAASDGAIASFLKVRLHEVGVNSFMLPDDAPPGSKWMDQIRKGLKSSDELVTLVTPTALSRPWITAEWACFWLRDRPTTPLLVGTRVSDLWEPMATSQATDLTNFGQTRTLLERFASVTDIQPDSGVSSMARDVCDEIPKIVDRIRRADIGGVIDRLSMNVQNNTNNIERADVLAAISADRIRDVVTIATADDAAPVKQRQIATALVYAGCLHEAFNVAVHIHNRNEIKNVAFAVLQKVRHPIQEESDEWRFLTGIFTHLGQPQIRNIRQRFKDLGLYPNEPWRLEEEETDDEEEKAEDDE